MQITSLKRVQNLLAVSASWLRQISDRLNGVVQTNVVNSSITVSISGTPSVNATISSTSLVLPVRTQGDIESMKANWVNGYLNRVRSS